MVYYISLPTRGHGFDSRNALAGSYFSVQFMTPQLKPDRVKFFTLGTLATVCGGVLAALLFDGIDKKQGMLYIPIVCIMSFVIGWSLSKRHYVNDSFL